MMADREDMLALYGVPGVGAVLFTRLMDHFHSASAVFAATDNDLRQVTGVREQIVSALHKFDRDSFLNDQEKRMKECGAEFITISDPDYPPLLAAHRSRPPFLFIRGNRKALAAGCIAIVGTRRPSGYGVSMARELAAGAVSAGYCIVSGMATGIDAVSHAAAIEHNGKTIAVFGCGVDILFPPENRGLARKIEAAGCLVSQFPMGMEPLRGHFPARNDVVVGLSMATIVVEAGTKSGALITADLTLKAGRPLFAVPGNANSDKSRGTNALFGKGAQPATDAATVISKLGGNIPPVPVTVENRLPMPEGMQGDIVRILENGQCHIEEISAKLGAPVHTILNELTMLELSGYVKEHPGKMFERTFQVN